MSGAAFTVTLGGRVVHVSPFPHTGHRVGIEGLYLKGGGAMGTRASVEDRNSGGSTETISDEEVDSLVNRTLDQLGVDMGTMRSYARRGRFDTESQRRAWFLISGLGRG